MTWNIQRTAPGTDATVQDNLQQTYDFIGKYQSDIVGLQETAVANPMLSGRDVQWWFQTEMDGEDDEEEEEDPKE